MPICLTNASNEIIYSTQNNVFQQNTFLNTAPKSYIPILYNQPDWTLCAYIPKGDYTTIYYTLFLEFLSMLVIYLFVYITSGLFIYKMAYNAMSDFVHELSQGLPMLYKGKRKRVFYEYAEKIEEMRKEIRRLITQTEQTSKQNAYLENQLLLSRINPHFIHNTLNSIRLQAAQEGKSEVSDTLLSLNNLLYHNLGKKRVVTLADELRAVEDYIFLQQRIYPILFVKHILVDEKTLSIQVPAFTLQPIVENSIKHAKVKELKLELTILHKENQLIISIKDNGTGMNKEKCNSLNAQLTNNNAQTMGIGLDYVNSSLKIAYANRAHLIIKSASNEGTQTDIIIEQI